MSILDSIEFPKGKKDAVLYTRVKHQNRIFVAQKAKKYNVSDSTLMDFIIDKIRAGEWVLKEEHANSNTRNF